MRRLLLYLTPLVLLGDAGVIIPSNSEKPDPKILSLAEMDVDVLIDNQVARVRIKQIFQSHRLEVLEGKYIFALPSRAAISDFAVWDDVVRIPGVILERRRAQEIYENLKWQAIDPGLLQQGEGDEDTARRVSMFTARIVPIPAYGTKRLEMEYHERIPVDQLQSVFALPLRPDVYNLQTAGRLGIRFEVRSKHPVKDLTLVSKAYPLKFDQRTPGLVKASLTGTGVNLSEDFAVKWALDAPKPQLEVLAHRDANEPGFFEASLLTGNVAPDAKPRTVIAMFDASLSMQWEKLERSYQALETLLRRLKPADQFNLIVFNEAPVAVNAAPVAATPEAIDKALAAVKETRLRGGTNLQAALAEALKQAPSPDAYVVLLGDGGSTRGLVHNGRLAAWYEAEWKRGRRPHTYIFGVGDDANLPLLQMLARQAGLFEWVRSTEPIEFKLNSFLSKIGVRPLDGLTLSAEPASNFDMVYALEQTVFPGSRGAWVGQYKQAGQGTFRAGGLTATAALPDRSADHAHLPRTWAKARVDALLEKIERDGEDAATIDEIIRLSRKYKFVTPYTSFLAAPRSLLRPRLIRPGDPVLRVRTDASISSVVAMFPFGLVKKLRYLPEEDTWQTRFLAPSDMKDGTYNVQLVLKDKQGRVFREAKSFVIASKPPIVRVSLAKRQFRAGETMPLRVSASDTTRTVVARMHGAAPVHLRWSTEAKSNTGTMIVPAHLPAGRYKLTVTAEDFAHNIGSEEVQIEVLP